jgi:RNA polymerase sigma-70 factor (ECF subfamily)
MSLLAQVSPPHCPNARNKRDSRKGSKISSRKSTDRRSLQALPSAEQAFRDFAPRIYSLAWRILGNDTDAEDIVQEVLLQVVRKLDTFRGESSFPTWLHRITVNAARTLQRRRAQCKERQMKDPLDHVFACGSRHNSPRPAREPDGQVIDREVSALIGEAIERLPTIYREVYTLADVEGLSNAEVGELLGLSLPAVKSRLHRGRQGMRSTLSRHFEEMCG